MTRGLSLEIEGIPDASEALKETAILDEHAFREFYAKTASPLRSYVSRVCGNRATADDILQEAYFRYLRAALPEMSEANQKSYLFRIATNLLRDHFRSSGKREHTVLSETVSCGDVAEKVEFRSDFERLFQMLQPKERQLLWLAYIEGYTHKEIAEATGLKAKSIRILLFRCRRKLAGMLREKGFSQRG